MISRMDYKEKRNQDDLVVFILAGNAAVMSGVVAWDMGELASAACLCSAILPVNSFLRLTGLIDKIDLTK